MSVKDSHSSLSPFRVLGIALVIDQRGKEPCVAFRYPTSLDSGAASGNSIPSTTYSKTGGASPPYSSTTKKKAPGGPTSSNGTSSSTSRRSDELFFSLSSRQMAKLFRPKHSLCGQPMTLSVGGTVFCFRAVLMGGNEDATATATAATATRPAADSASITSSSQHSIHSNSSSQNNSTNTNNNNNNNNKDDSEPLVLFSVVIALASQVDHNISCLPVAGWFEATPGTYNTYSANPYSNGVQPFPDTASHGSRHKPKDPTTTEDTNQSTTGSGASHTTHHTNTSATLATASMESQRAASSSFLAVRRIHVSLTRLCRVLQREERRCRYISWQSQSFFQIRAELQGKWDETTGATTTTKTTTTTTTAMTPAIVAADSTNSNTTNGATATRPPVGSSGDGVGVGTNSPKTDLYGKTPPSSGSGILSSSDNDNAASVVAQRHKPQHRRGHSLIAGANIGSSSLSNTLSADGGLGGLRSTKGGTTTAKNMSVDGTGIAGPDVNSLQYQQKMMQEDREQEILEQVLASAGLRIASYHSSSSSNRRMADLQHGNLGRELVQVFHALSRNDHYFPPSSSVLSGRDGVVYINRHIAVALEAVSLPKVMSSLLSTNAMALRPYHTLIFPNASPSELLQSLQSSGFTAPLQQLLLMVRPSKPLTDIAVDANLPLSVTMELANYLVSHRACVAATVLTRNSRLACKDVDRIQELALDFSQTFDNWSLSPFLVASFLTTNGRTLGESMTALTTSGDDAIAAALRVALLGSMLQEGDNEDYVFVRDTDDSDESSDSCEDVKQKQFHPRAEELEEMLYSLAIWLLSHQIIGQIQDYLFISVDPLHSGTSAPSKSPPSNLHSEKIQLDPEYTVGSPDVIGSDSISVLDEALLKELQESDCLLGTASITAISWRLGLDEDRLRSWAIRQDKIRIVSRLARPSDDWESA